MRSWALQNAQNQKTPVAVLKLANQKAVEIDLSKVKLPPGDYHLAGYWDWTPFQATGAVHVRPLSNFERAKLRPASQDRLIAKTGKIPVTLEGDDFEFTTKLELKKVGDEFATAQPIRFILPKGLRKGIQDHIDVQIDTADLEPGEYALLVSQQDDKDHPVNIKVLPPLSKIDNLPILANQGLAAQHYVLKGERLNLLARLDAPGVAFDLGPVALTESERNVTVHLKSDPRPGTVLPIKAYLVDRNEPLTLPNALRITGPLPLIASFKLSLPANMAVAIKSGEFPAGYTLSAVLDVKNIEPRSMLRLTCLEDVGSRLSLRLGEQTETASLQQLSPDQIFLSFDTSAWPAACSVQAEIDNGSGGKSEPLTLGHIIRLPQIDDFRLDDVTLSGNQAAPGAHVGVLTGRNLEMIEKVGWDQTNGSEVPGLPSPIPGQGQKQSLHVNLPDPPAPHAALYLWLRGEKIGRATTVTNSAPPPSNRQPSSAPASNTASPPSTSPLNDAPPPNATAPGRPPPDAPRS